MRKTFERAEVLGQWIETIEKNVDQVRHYIQKLDNLSVNQRGNYQLLFVQFQATIFLYLYIFR